MKHIIKNYEEIGTTPLRRDALDILEEGYAAILTKGAVLRTVSKKENGIQIQNEEISFSDYERIFVVAIGKCATEAGSALEEIFGEKITDGIVLDMKSGEFKKLRSFVGTHPYPSEQNVSAVKEIVAMISELTEKDLVIAVISGGGSSLLSLPHKITTEELTAITRKIMDKSAPIRELNIVRKHLSDIQGGSLAKTAYPAKVISLIFSDVPGNDIATIASGPTVLDTSTKEEAEVILAKYDIRAACELPELEMIETPKDEKYFANVKNLLIVTNTVALNAMAKKAAELGYNASVESDRAEGIAREFGEELAKKELPAKTCLLYGGEMTVHVVANPGIGGRNQEFVLGGLPYLKSNAVLVGASSDGRDYSDAAGAMGDKELFETAKEKGLNPADFLANNNSFEYFKQAGGHIHTGPTGANIADLYFILTKK
jgi:glycerate-2-kinase